MQDPSVEIVGHVLAALDEQVVPHLSAPAARAFADLCSRLLHQVLVRERQLENIEARREAASRPERERLDALLKALPGSKPSQREHPLVRAFATRLDCVDGQSAGPISEAMRRLVQVEREYLEALDPEVQFGIASMFAGGRVDRDRVAFGVARAAQVSRELDAGSLRARLRRLGPESRAVEVRALSRIQGGFSKQTLRLELEGSPWSGTRFIIRRDRPNAYTGTTVVNEFPVLRAMFAAGLEVPEPLWVEPAGELGPAFIIVRHVEGANDTGAWRNSPASVERFLQSLAGLMARLHRVPPGASGLGDGSSASVPQLIREDIERWSALARLEQPHAPVLLVAEKAWLLQNIPESAPTPVVVHSDIGFHNMLTRDGEVTALLDWEFCHLGDPQEDLNYVRPFIETVGEWSRFLELYRAAGGYPFRPEEALFWKVWGSFRSGAGCHSALHSFREGSFASAAEAVTLAVSGMTFGPRYELEVAELIAGSKVDVQEIGT